MIADKACYERGCACHDPRDGDGVEVVACPPPPHECKTDAEKIAYAFGWFKALELNPARKPWVGLTEEDLLELYKKFTDSDEWTYERAIEAKLKEKNCAN